MNARTYTEVFREDSKMLSRKGRSLSSFPAVFLTKTTSLRVNYTCKAKRETLCPKLKAFMRLTIHQMTLPEVNSKIKYSLRSNTKIKIFAKS